MRPTGQHCRRRDDHGPHWWAAGERYCSGGPVDPSSPMPVRKPRAPRPVEVRPAPPTERQEAVLSFIDAFQMEHGWPPSVREIGSNFGIRSTNGVHGYLRALEGKGLISRVAGQARSIRITERGREIVGPAERGVA